MVVEKGDEEGFHRQGAKTPRGEGGKLIRCNGCDWFLSAGADTM
jgi:hypothetical protein